MLYHRVRAKMHAQFGEQPPQLEGEHDRVVFGSRIIEQIYAVNILNVLPHENHDEYVVELEAGQLHTLQQGAQFWVYPNPIRVSDPLERLQRLAYLEISELGAARSKAVLNSADARQIEGGDQAVLITPGPLRFSHKVGLVYQSEPQLIGNQEVEPLRKVAAAIQQYNGAFLRLADSSEKPDFLIMVTSDLNYEIQDVDGQPVHHLRPPLSIGAPGAAKALVERLVHLAKYRNVLRLENQSGPSFLVGKLHVELRRDQENEQTQWKSEAGASLILEPDEKINLVITNNSLMRLHVAVLDLEQDWSIRQLYPEHDTLMLEPQEGTTIPLKTELTSDYRVGTDTLKIFAAFETTDFAGLSLPPLDQPHRSDHSRGSGPRNALEELLEAFYSDAPQHRGLRVLTRAEWEWTCTSVEVSIRQRSN
jgi:hypothetical protein